MVLQTIRFAAAMALLWALPTFGQSSLPPPWLASLQAGGYVIVLRHGATNADQTDSNPFDPKDTVHQRQLSDAGRAQAKAMGDALHKLKIPVGKVQASQYQRAVDTGALLGFGGVSPTADLTESSHVMAAKDDRQMGAKVPSKENDRRMAALRALAATPPPAGTNVVLVTHKPNILDAFGKDWSDVGEGEASIFKPDGKGGYTLVARIQAAEWPRLAQAKP